MIPYQERVFSLIDSFSNFDGSVIELAKSVFMCSEIYDMQPTTIAVCCLNISNNYLYGSEFKTIWSDVIMKLQNPDVRKSNKITHGNKFYKTIIRNSKTISETVDLNKEFENVKVILNGSEIGEEE
jgi:hypothetical protein